MAEEEEYYGIIDEISKKVSRFFGVKQKSDMTPEEWEERRKVWEEIRNTPGSGN